VEHHLFPRVPTRRLPALAMRIERIAPDLCSKRVL
jgi:fatty acid desaturase